MITRSAIFEGRIRPGSEAAFQRGFEELVPLWRLFPHASNVRLMWGHECDDAERPIAMIQQVDYPSREALAEAMASPVRAQARAQTLELLKMFEGRFYHLISTGNQAAEHGPAS